MVDLMVKSSLMMLLESFLGMVRSFLMMLESLLHLKFLFLGMHYPHPLQGFQMSQHLRWLLWTLNPPMTRQFPHWILRNPWPPWTWTLLTTQMPLNHLTQKTEMIQKMGPILSIQKMILLSLNFLMKNPLSSPMTLLN